MVDAQPAYGEGHVASIGAEGQCSLANDVASAGENDCFVRVELQAQAALKVGHCVRSGSLKVSDDLVGVVSVGANTDVVDMNG